MRQFLLCTLLTGLFVAAIACDADKTESPLALSEAKTLNDTVRGTLSTQVDNAKSTLSQNKEYTSGSGNGSLSITGTVTTTLTEETINATIKLTNYMISIAGTEWETTGTVTFERTTQAANDDETAFRLGGSFTLSNILLKWNFRWNNLTIENILTVDEEGGKDWSTIYGGSFSINGYSFNYPNSN